MKRLLFSSILAVILMSASCGRNDQNAEAGSSEVNEDHSEIESEGTSGVKPIQIEATKVSDEEDSVQNELPAKEEAVHEPLTPNPSALDSVKSSYPKKK